MAIKVTKYIVLVSGDETVLVTNECAYKLTKERFANALGANWDKRHSLWISRILNEIGNPGQYPIKMGQVLIADDLINESENVFDSKGFRPKSLASSPPSPSRATYHKRQCCGRFDQTSYLD
jgi:hypothetical protein